MPKAPVPTLDMNSVDFAGEALSFPPMLLVSLLHRDDLKCTNEDQILDFILEYLEENQ